MYLRSTTFATTDTTEIGFLIGLHPSITHIDWRTNQIHQALGNTDLVPRFQLYRRKLQVDETSTSVIVIRCAKQDVQDLTAAIINIPPHTLGKGVEFIPYHLISVWKKAEYLDIYHQQNQYIHDTGAIAIQGIDSSVMEEEINGLTLQQYLLSQEHILSIKKSDMPNTGKWWILVKKSHMELVTTFLNEDVDLYLTNSALKHDYTPPCDIPLRNTEQTDHTVQTNEYTSALLLRLKNRPKLTLIHTEPPPTGRVRKSYGRTYAQTVTQGPVPTYKHYGPQTTPHTGKPSEVQTPQYGQELDALKKIDRTSPLYSPPSQ